MANNDNLIREADIYAGFSGLTRLLLKLWKKILIKLDDYSRDAVIPNLNQSLRDHHVVIFFDHNYTFDPLPAGLATAEYIDGMKGMLVPFAVHLDMGIDREGRPSLGYRMRTGAFHWFSRNIVKTNPTIQILPVVREFEMESPNLRRIVEEAYPGINTKYLRTLIQNFSNLENGQICFLSPYSGIAFPGKPAFHPQLHRSIKIMHGKAKGRVSYYLIGAYPDWKVKRKYYFPALSKHEVLLSGPIDLPIKDYEASTAIMDVEIAKLRQRAGFEPLDYEHMFTK